MGTDHKTPVPVLAYSQGADDDDPAARAGWRKAFIVTTATYAVVVVVLAACLLDPVVRGDKPLSYVIPEITHEWEMLTIWCLTVCNFIALAGFYQRSQGKPSRALFLLYGILQPLFVVGYAVATLWRFGRIPSPELTAVLFPLASAPWFILLIRALRSAIMPRRP